LGVEVLMLTAAVVVGAPGLAAALHLGTLALASLLYRERCDAAPPGLRFLVLVPAHDEARVIGGCLDAVAADRRAGDSVLVVADRCNDATAAVAGARGASVLERGPDEPPGRAAARQAGLDHARGLAWDAVVMLDADSVIQSGFFDACERALGAGATAVQARSESRRGRALPAEVALAAFSLQGITLPRGRDRLGLSVRLRGTGMAIRRDVALGHRFRAPASEDLFFTLDLLLDGIRCRHVERARLRSESASSWGAFGGQKMRYEAGRMAAARAYVPRLVRRSARHRDLASLEAAWFLATPPFALAALSVSLATALAAAAGSAPVARTFGACLLVLVLVLVTGLVQARAGVRTWLALLAAPWYVGFKAVVQLRAFASLRRRDDYYPPTARV
jgi:cellulose synthase/poly-beta-1,6-N-acetylglucosamine synthase-like glycosyltransferase